MLAIAFQTRQHERQRDLAKRQRSRRGARGRRVSRRERKVVRGRARFGQGAERLGSKSDEREREGQRSEWKRAARVQSLQQAV